GARVLDDVPDLVGREAEVDRHQDPSERADAEERDQEAGRVRAHDRDPLALADAHALERDRHAAGAPHQPGEADAAERPGRAGLADRRDPVAVELGAVEIVADDQRDPHAASSRFRRTYPGAGPMATAGRRGPLPVGMPIPLVRAIGSPAFSARPAGEAM